MNPSSTHDEPPPTYTKSGQQQITTADFQVGKYSLQHSMSEIDSDVNFS